MNEYDQKGLELYEDHAAYYEDWSLVLAWKWRMVSGYAGGVGLAWPVGEKPAYPQDVCYGLA